MGRSPLKDQNKTVRMKTKDIWNSNRENKVGQNFVRNFIMCEDMEKNVYGGQILLQRIFKWINKDVRCKQNSGPVYMMFLGKTENFCCIVAVRLNENSVGFSRKWNNMKMGSKG